MTEVAVRADELVKRYGDKVALDRFNLTVPYGTVYGLLGPNGAGKTTAVRILSTLIRPNAGRALVAGFDVVRQPMEVRRRIGLTGQYAAVDEILTGRQNLEMFGRLFHLGARQAKARTAELLEQFDLTEAGDKGVKEYSGGMRRRLDLAASFILAPELLFLDEPTSGLDPRGRNDVWAAVRDLVARGTTVLLTTQYLEEADRLADRVAVIDRGRTIADDTPEALKDAVGGDSIEVIVAEPAGIPEAAKVVARVCEGEPETDDEDRRVSGRVTDRVAALTYVAGRLQDLRVAVDDIGLRRPTLDDVFLRLTGHRAVSSSDDSADDNPDEKEAVTA
jgi:ABC-2 type transport system ATP-binding protein